MIRNTILAIALAAGLAACGDDDSDGGSAPPPDPAFVSIKVVVDRNCGGCHNGTTHPLRFDSSAKFKTAKVKTRIANGSMPPSPKRLSDEDKKALLEYL